MARRRLELTPGELASVRLGLANRIAARAQRKLGFDESRRWWHADLGLLVESILADEDDLTALAKAIEAKKR